MLKKQSAEYLQAATLSRQMIYKIVSDDRVHAIC